MMNKSSEQRHEQTSNEKLSKKGNYFFLLVQLISLIIVFIALIENGSYGWSLFCIIPFSIGLTIGTYTKTQKTRKLLHLSWKIFLVITCLNLLLLLLGIEGVICILMALGLIILPALIGIFIGYTIRYSNKISILLLLLVLNTSSIAYDFNSDKKVNSIATASLIINSDAETIWETLTNKVDFSISSHKLLKAGISYPLDMALRIDSCNEYYIFCNLNNGSTKLKIDKLDSLKHIKFSMPEPIVPMKELSIYNEIHAPHLEGYFEPLYGEFIIIPNSSYSCKLIARTAYSYKITPDFYWQWWTNYLANSMHRHVLKKIKSTSEKS